MMMMHTRSQCSRCSKRLPFKPSSATIRCPSCKFENRIPSVGSLGSQDQGRNSLVGRFVVRIKTEVLRRGNGGSKSLNCQPSSLLSSKSFSVERPSRKRALLIGVTYASTKHTLKGTIIDVKSIRSLLINTFHFPEENILVLTEEEPDPEFVPTKKNIENSLKWLVEDCQGGDSLVFYFSGHGVRQFDFDSDESDGFDETICPVDFEKEGMISDDAIKSAIVRPLKKGVTLNAIVDACHSGTVLDLSYVYYMKEQVSNLHHKFQALTLNWNHPFPLLLFCDSQNFETHWLWTITFLLETGTNGKPRAVNLVIRSRRTVDWQFQSVLVKIDKLLLILLLALENQR